MKEIYKINNIVKNKAKDRCLTLAFIGNSNWDLYVSKGGNLYSISKDWCNKGDSHFGDKHHIKRLMSNGLFSVRIPTEAGLELIGGLTSAIMDNCTILKFI